MELKRALFIVAASALLVAACRPGTDRNQTCTLVRAVDGGTEALTEGFVQSHTKTNKDFITFGSTDCEDLVCVRDSTFPKGADLNAKALGYCSSPCAVGTTTGCTSYDEQFDKDPSTKLSCRALLLDVATLGIIAADGGSADIGGAKDPYYCARGTGAIGGSDAGQ